MSEKNKKKAYFIRKTIKSLGLKNAEILDYAITSKTKGLGPFDVITARALAETKKIINMSEQLLTDAGIFLLMKGKKERIIDEVNGLDINQYSYTIHTKILDEMQRHILEIHKQ
jgi:16S rRNA G527 N7-methylase RsmG